MITQELLNYVKQSLGKRQSREEIKSALLENGWDDVDVEEAFQEIDRNPNVTQKEKGGANQYFNKKTWLPVAISLGIFLLFAGSVAGYFIFVKQYNNHVTKTILDEQENILDKKDTGKNNEIPSDTDKIKDVKQNIKKKANNIKKDAVPQEKKEVPDTSKIIKTPVPAPPAKVTAPPEKVTATPSPQIDDPIFISGPIKKITTCTDISSPGKYILSQNIVSSDKEPCIKIHDTSDVLLDCANYSITANARFYHNIFVDKVKNFIISSCTLKNKTPQSLQNSFLVINSQTGSITKNVFTKTTSLYIGKSSNIRFTDNLINSALNVNESSKTLIQNNDFILIPTTDRKQTNTLLLVSGGSNNTVKNNTFDGASDGVFNGLYGNVGADDSIILVNERNALIEGNYIKNNWDLGIENTDYLFDSKIINNRIENTGVAGIGGWYYSSVKGNIFDGNVVKNSPQLFDFFRVYGIKDGAPPVYFKDNTFINNKLANQKRIQPASWFVIDTAGSRTGPGIRELTEKDIVTGNNIFKNNDFGKARAPVFSPKDMIIDGGGNICAQPDVTDYPLRCGS